MSPDAEPVLHEISFFYDPISPYAHLAFQRLPEALMGHSVHLRYQPVLFAALLKAQSQLGACRAWGVESENRPQRGQFLPDSQPHSPAMGQEAGEKWTAAADLQPALPKSDRLLGPAELPGKREWTYRQVSWLAHHHGVHLDLPAEHPFNPLALLRLGLSCAMDEAPGDTSRWVAEQLLHHVWQGGHGATDPQRLADMQTRLQDHVTECGRTWLAPDSEVVKQRLRSNTEQALALGLFGVPSLVLNGRVFWGQDALPMLRACLDGDPWFQGPAWEDASQLPAGVQRPI